jgi:hypothetical protein
VLRIIMSALPCTLPGAPQAAGLPDRPVCVTGASPPGGTPAMAAAARRAALARPQGIRAA